MDRINTASKAVDLFGVGKHGWKNRNVATGVEPTDFNAEWCNAQQEEKMSVIEGAGIVPAAGVFTQLRQALKRMFGGNVTTVNAANSPFVLTADHAGLVIMEATAGNISATLPAANALTTPFKLKFLRADSTANTATATCAGADTLVGVGASFIVAGQGDYRVIESDAAALWWTLAKAAPKALSSLTATVAANALTGSLSAETIDFRSTTLTSGVPVTRNAAAASLVVPSGATLGTIATVAARLVWGWIDNAGTPEPFVCNLAGGRNLDETTVISTTAISAAAGSANVFYSTTARANVAFRVRGFCDITEAVAGTWAAAPTLVQPAGGQAVAALSSLGYGQTWQDVAASRATNTTYYNTTGKPISVSVMCSGNGAVSAIVGGVTAASSGNDLGNTQNVVSFIVPPGMSYSISTLTSKLTWAELR